MRSKTEWCYTVAMKNYIVKNATIYTQNKEQPWAEAFVVRGGKFVCVGTNEEVDNWIVSQDTEVLTDPEETLDLAAAREAAEQRVDAALEKLSFAYEPGENDVGGAVLSGFSADIGTMLILR